jgi:hypothetical protein
MSFVALAAAHPMMGVSEQLWLSKALKDKQAVISHTMALSSTMHQAKEWLQFTSATADHVLNAAYYARGAA